MFRYMSNDIKRIVKKKSSILIFTIFFAIVCSLIYLANIADIQKFEEIFITGPILFINFSSLLFVFIVLMMVVENDKKFYTRIIELGISKKKIVIVKFLETIILSIAMFIFYIVIYYLGIAFKLNWNIEPIQIIMKYIYIIGFGIIPILAIIAFVMIFLFNFRNKILLIYLVLMIISKITTNFKIVKYSEYLPMEFLDDIRTGIANNILNTSVNIPDMGLKYIISFSIMIISILITIFIFERRKID